MPADFHVDTPPAKSPTDSPSPPMMPLPDAEDGFPGFVSQVWETDDERTPPATEPQKAEPKPAQPPEEAPPEAPPMVTEEPGEDTPEPESAAPAPSDAEPRRGVSDAELQRQMAELRAEKDKLEQRLADTQRWGNQASMSNAVARAIVEANEHQRRIQAEIDRRKEESKFPGFDGEEALSDPTKLLSSVEGAAAWARDSATSQLAPYISRLEAEVQAIRQATPLIEELARTTAVRQLRRQHAARGLDLDEAQAESLVDKALSTVIAAEDNAAAYRINPSAIQYAANLTMQADGAPIKAKPKPTPTVGKGETKPRRSAAPQKSKQAAKAESLLGVQFNEEDLRELERLNARR